MHASGEVNWRPRASGGRTFAHDGPELSLLLAAASGRSGSTLARFVAPGLDWHAFAELAESHHVVPLIQPALETLPGMPAAVRSRLRQAQRFNAGRVLYLAAQLAQLAEMFDAAGIAAVPFKGPALALQAYPSLTRRNCGDLDILIRPTDVRRAKRLLLDRGHELNFPNCSAAEARFLRAMDEPTEAAYLRRACEYHLWKQADRVNIDLHWRINPPELCLPLDEPAMFGRLKPVTFIGRRMMQLDSADALLVLCCNGAKDCWKRLDRICDVAELLRSHPDTNWSAALASADRIGARRILLLGLELAHRLLDGPLSPQLSVAIRSDSLVPALVPLVRRGLVGSLEMPEMQWQLESALFHLRMRERIRDRVRYCAARLCPTVGDWTSLKLPAGLSFLYYLVRPLRLAGRACALPLRLAANERELSD